MILETNIFGDVTGRNVYGLNLLIRTVGVDTFYYMYNGHADVTALLTPEGAVAASYYYDAFGNILEQTGDVSNSVLFAGYQYDKETGLYYLNARMYDPVTARFVQEDTYAGQQEDPLSLNLYTYCHKSPLMYWDPTGHSAEYVSKSVGYYNYHGNLLSMDSANDNMAQREMRTAMWKEYPGKTASSPADLAMINAGYGDAFKSPPVVYKTIWINKETKEVVSYEEVLKARAKDEALENMGQKFAEDEAGKAIVTPGLEIFAENDEIHNIYYQVAMNQIAAEGGELSFQNIENQALKLWLTDYLTAQIQDPESVRPSVEGFFQWANETKGGQLMYSLGESTVNLFKDAGKGLYESSANLGELAYATQAYFNGTGSAEDLSRELNQQGSYFMGFGIGVFEAVTLKPLYEAAGSVETALNGTSYISNATNKVYSGIDNTLNYTFDMDMEAYNSTKSVGTVAVMVAGMGDVGIRSARKAQVDKFIKTKVDKNFQTSVRDAFTKDTKVTTNWFRDRVAYRYHGGTSSQNSYWLTPKQTLNPAADLALPPGNSYQFVDKFIIPRGTTFLEGGVAPNFGQPGGAIQYYIADPTMLIKAT